MFFLTTLLKWTVKIVGTVARIAAFLLIKLGQWVPLAFALGYFVVCYNLNIAPDNKVGSNVLLYGCIVSIVLGFAGAVLLREYRRGNIGTRPRETVAPKSKKQYTGGKSAPYKKYYEDYDDQKNTRIGYEQNASYKAHEAVDEFGNEKKYVLPPEVLPSRAREAGNNEALQSASVRTESFSNFQSNVDAFPRVPGNFGEKPFVFATRKDPNIFIVEYSDRLLFYRRARFGEPELIATEYKQ